jgi:hypothetical protein
VVVGVASEAGIWRQGGGNGLYRQTWVSGLHPSQAPVPLELTVAVRFDDETSVRQRAMAVAPGQRWSLNLDELRTPVPTQANASITITANACCAATVALWHAPIGRGVAPVVYAVPFVCVEESPHG